MNNEIPESETLSLDDLVKLIGMNKSALVRYLSESETRAIMRPVGNPPRYPRTSLPLFEAIARAHEAGTMKPKTAAAILRERFGIRNEQENLPARRDPSDLVFRIPESGQDDRLTRAVMSIERIAARQDEDEETWTAKEVAAKLRMSESWVRENVPFIRFGRKVRYRPSIVRKLISESGIQNPKRGTKEV